MKNHHSIIIPQKFSRFKYFIIILLLFLIISCNDNEFEKINAFIEVGDYSNAITLLNQKIEENPKNIQSRKLLMKCYDMNSRWDKSLEQLNIIQNIEPSKKNEYRKLLYIGLNKEFTKLEEKLKDIEKIPMQLAYEQLKNEISKLNSKRSYLIDSLNWNSDSLLNNQDYKKIHDNYTRQYKSFLDSIGVNYYMGAVALFGIHEDRRYYLNDFIYEYLKQDSTIIYYLEEPIRNYLRNIKKPKPNSYNVDHFYGDLREYYELKAKMNELIGNYKVSLEEYDNMIYWYKKEAEEKEIKLKDAIEKYEPKIDLLMKIGNYEEVLDTVNKLKESYTVHDKKEANTLENWIKLAQINLQ